MIKRLTELEKLKLILNSPLANRDTMHAPRQGRSTMFVPGYSDPVPYILKESLLEWIEDIEKGKWPLYE